MPIRSGRIMVVDDDVYARTAIAELLRQEGFDVATALDASRALGKLATFTPDLVLTDLDLVMPDTDGIELTTQLQAAPDAVAVVVMTASEAVSSAIDAMRAGACDYLTKPIHCDELLLVIDRVFEDLRRRREIVEAQERVREQLAFTSAMASSLGEGTLAIDLEEKVTFLNEAGASLLGCRAEDAVGMRGADTARVETCDGRIVESPLTTAIRTGDRVRSDDHVFVRADGVRFRATYTATPIRRDGAVTGAVIAFDDITERRERYGPAGSASSGRAGNVMAASLDFAARRPRIE
jgi:PAS domain S-box-containing protein